jgi:phage shock protein A
MQPEEAVREFMGDRPGADELTEWRATLEDRLKKLEAERDKGDKVSGGLANKITQLKKQIAALRQEEAITQFVEDSVRATLAMGTIAEGMEGAETSRLPDREE